MRSNRNPRKGQTIVLMAAFIGFLFSLSALAFDMAFAMMIRAKLVSAMDAATLSAIRAVPKGLGSMQQAANRTFQANLPPGQLLTTNPVVNTPTMVWDNGTVRVTMGDVQDYYRGNAPSVSYCDMMTSHSKHMWRSLKVGTCPLLAIAR